jgi:hypothetical protein
MYIYIYFKYIPTALPTDNFCRYFTESCQTITTDAIITDGNIGVYHNYYRRNIRRYLPLKIQTGVVRQ